MTTRALLEDNHEDERGRSRLTAKAELLSEKLLASGVLEMLLEPDEHGRTIRLAPALQEDFALNQPLASFALEAFELIDLESETYALDVLSVVEAILDDPSSVLMAQANQARGEGGGADEGRRRWNTRSACCCSRRSPTRGRWPSRSSRRFDATARTTRGCSRPICLRSRSCVTCTAPLKLAAALVEAGVP